MSLRLCGILVIFALFLLIFIINPNLSCFGRRIKSPLYPLFRRKKKKIKVEDYGFSIVDDRDRKVLSKKEEEIKRKGYGFSRVGGNAEQELKVKKREIKTDDYGFSLVDDEEKEKPQGGKEK